MKKLIIIILVLVISFNAHSQLSTNETPPSYKESYNKENIPMNVMPSLNYELIRKEDSIDNLNGLPPRFGFDFDVDINMDNSGQWIELPNKKGRLWQLIIYCPGALSINLLYDKFYIPEGGKFFIYSSDHKKKIGAFTQRNNKGDRMKPGAFATSLILNEKIVLEYYEPYNSKKVPIISVAKVVHGYRYITPFNFGDSDDDCEININCQLGVNWQDEKTSVALIVVGGTRWCTGSLINNTLGDGAPYLLTANHCLDGLDAISNPTASTWTFLWNYESQTCENGTDFTPPSTTGATVVANNSASDFALLELVESPFDLLPSLCLYYNGWDRSNSIPSNTTCIHHPRGDIKKISVSNTSLSSNGNFWDVTFSQGIVEPGSSGSPLYNENSRVVGQLLGTPTNDPISCQNQDGLAIYGKFSVSWNNSTDQRRRLKDWLDPLGTNPNTLDGAYLFPANNCYISGTSLVCTSNSTFTLNNRPPGTTVNWTPSDNLDEVSGDGTDTYTVKAISSSTSGSGWVEAEISVTGCGDVTVRKDVWVGVPSQPTDIYPLNESGDNVVCLNDIKTYNYLISNEDSEEQISSWNWMVWGGHILQGQGTRTISVQYFSVGNSIVELATENVCGESASLNVPVSVVPPNLCRPYPGPDPFEGFKLSIQPNPANNYLEAEILDENFEQSSNNNINIKLFNNRSIPVYTGNSHQQTFRINTSNLPHGLYLLQIIYKGEKYSEQILIEH